MVFLFFFFLYFTILEDITARSLGDNNQWSYDLPHPLVNTSIESISKERRNFEGNQRRPKLTVGFAQDLGRMERESQAKVIPENDFRYSRIHKLEDDESSRGLSPEAIAKITETLGAINTVGRYLVNYTRGAASPTDLFTNEAQQASPVGVRFLLL